MLLLDDDDELPLVPTAHEAAFAASLGGEGVAAIDERLLRHASAAQSKVAKVIDEALEEAGFDPWEDGCVELHARRVIALVEAGRLQGFGRLRKPRWSEVRLPTAP